MALNCSPEFKGLIVQIVCVTEIRFESAWALTNITSGKPSFKHPRQVVLKMMIYIFSCVFL